MQSPLGFTMQLDKSQQLGDDLLCMCICTSVMDAYTIQEQCSITSSHGGCTSCMQGAAFTFAAQDTESVSAVATVI